VYAWIKQVVSTECRGVTGRVEGAVAVVTGSGGAMGGAIAQRLAEEGAVVALNDRVAGATDETEEAIRALGRDVTSVHANVTRRAEAERLIGTAVERWGRVDVLVNVVGGVRPPVRRAIWELSEEDWEFTIGLNLRGTFHCTQLVLPGMMARRSGKIVNIASTSWAGEAAHTDYAVAKAGVVAFTRSVATQLGPFNINVNAVSPGGTRRSARVAQQIEDQAGEPMSVAGTGTLGRLNEPVDIANAVLFLASEESRNVTGMVLTVAGGTNHSL
jgi:3-oxoacyl-[acyl-carrier protein] reductase